MEVKPATRDRLGAIIVGDGFKVTEEGVLTINEKSIEQEKYIEFTRKRLEQIFKRTKARRR